MTRLVYLDTETTGLDPDRHEIWEVAWAVDDDLIRWGVLNHSLRHADPIALKLNGYHRRAHRDLQADEHLLRTDLDGATLVAANPAFDAGFLRNRWGTTPWHYRLLDIEAYAMGALGYDTPKGLSTITADLVARGFDITTPDHTARGDVATLRGCHRALRSLYTSGTRYGGDSKVAATYHDGTQP